MRKILLLVFVLMTCGLNAQNLCGTIVPGDLVINGGFEEFTTVPTNLDLLENACNWWTGANTATPDYLHRNATSTNVSIPNNQFGIQDVNPTQGGNGYAGIWLIPDYFQGGRYTEIISTQLATPLQPNTQYTLSFDVSLSDFFSTNPIRLQAFLGAQFSINSWDELPIQNDPNGILLENNALSTNTTSWDTLTFTFTTGNTAGQAFLYLGGISNTQYQNPNATNPFESSYYYIDNVSLVEVDNCPECDLTLGSQIRTDLWETLQEDQEECGRYSFVIPQLDDCLELVIDWGDGQTNTVSSADSGTILSHQYNSDNEYTICHQLFVDGVLCSTFCDRRIVECEGCPECNTEITNQLLDDFWSSIQNLNDQKCGLYTFNIPTLPECYEIAVDWGDGQVDIVSSSDSGTLLPHQYATNGSFVTCAQVFIDGVLCGKAFCKTLDVNCYEPDPECNWLKSIGTTNGSPQEETGVSVVVDSNDDVILLGASLPNTNIEGTVIAGTTYLAKYDPTGCFISATDISFVGVPVDMDINNNDELLILTKDNIGFGNANNRYYLNKLDSSGNLLWTVTLFYTQASSSGTDTVKMDLKRSTNEVFLLTTVESTLDVTHTGGITTLQQIFGATAGKASILKIDSNGSLAWSQTAYGAGSVKGYSISASENTDELFFLGAGFSEGVGNQNNVIFRNNNTGVASTALMVSNSHGLSDSTDFIAKLTSSGGAFITHSCFPDWRSSSPTSIIYNHNANQLFTLYLQIPNFIGNFISIVDANLVLVNQYLYNSNAVYSSEVVDQSLYVAGISSGSRFHISKVNSSGVIWGRTPSNSFSLARDVAFNGDKIYTTGYFQNNPIILGNGDLINHIGGYDAFLTRLEDQGGSGIFLKLANTDESSLIQQNEITQKGFTMYPNPASSEIRLKFAEEGIKQYQVYIRNAYGKIVLQSQNQETLEVSSLKTGVYHVEIITEKGKHFVNTLLIK